MSQERRQHPRLPIRFACELSRDGARIESTTRDISRGGFAIVSPIALERDEVLEVALRVGAEDSAPILVHARVCWAAPDGEGHFAGLRFEGLDDETQARIDRALMRIPGT